MNSTSDHLYKRIFTESKTIPTELCENVTWIDLFVKQKFWALTPGKYYRITDYNTVVVDEGAGSELIRSAGHQFDVIVLALTESTLSEDAFAAYNEINDSYDIGYPEKMDSII